MYECALIQIIITAKHKKDDITYLINSILTLLN